MTQRYEHMIQPIYPGEDAELDPEKDGWELAGVGTSRSADGSVVVERAYWKRPVPQPETVSREDALWVTRFALEQSIIMMGRGHQHTVRIQDLLAKIDKEDHA